MLPDVFFSKTRKSVQIRAVLECLEERNVEVRQTVYTYPAINRRSERYDAVRVIEGNRFFYGIVEGIFERRATGIRSELKGCIVILVRMLERSDAEPENSSIVKEYGYEGLQYSLINGDAVLATVPLFFLSRKVVIL